MEFDVVWNGTLGGANRGHLCVIADIPRDAPEPSGIDAAAPVVEQVASALTDWATMTDLAARLHIPRGSVEVAIRALRRRGLIDARDNPGRTQQGSHRQYRWRPARRVAA